MNVIGIIKKSGIPKMLVFGILVMAMAAFAEPVLRPAGIETCMNAIRAYHSLPEDSVDVVIFGSSRAWRGLDTVLLHDEYGINAYNYGVNWQKINTTALFVKDALKQQSPKIAVVEVRNLSRSLKNKEFCGEIYYTRALSWNQELLNYLKRALNKSPVDILSYLFPVISTHNSWTDLVDGRTEGTLSVQELLENRGCVIDRTVSRITPVTLGDNSKGKELKSSSRQYLDSIVETCREKGVQVIFYLTPCTGDYYYTEAMEKYAAENGCAYLDGFSFLHETGIDPETDYFDRVHLNGNGSRKLSSFLGEYITRNYELT